MVGGRKLGHVGQELGSGGCLTLERVFVAGEIAGELEAGVCGYAKETQDLWARGAASWVDVGLSVVT